MKNIKERKFLWILWVWFFVVAWFQKKNWIFFLWNTAFFRDEIMKKKGKSFQTFKLPKAPFFIRISTLMILMGACALIISHSPEISNLTSQNLYFTFQCKKGPLKNPKFYFLFLWKKVFCWKNLLFLFHLILAELMF